MGQDADGEFIDAPDAPDYSEPSEEAREYARSTMGSPDLPDWRIWPVWAKLRFLRRLRTEGAGRPEQYVDDTLEWYLWLLLGGRGSGKSDEASRWSAEDALRLARIRFALVARTFGDVRDTMFEGETGVLAVIPDSELRGGSRERAYNRSLGELFLANGSRFKGFSSEKPNALRGPQHHRAWLDEASSWEDANVPNLRTKKGLAPAVDTTMSNLMLGMRLKPPDGSGVRMVAATTPKPNELTDFLEQHSHGVVRILSTYSNLQNLDSEVAEVVVSMYEGTDVAAQELEGRILKQAKGAAWSIADMEEARNRESFGELAKTVLGIDPAAKSDETSDETGLVVVHLERRDLVEVQEDGAEKTIRETGVEVAADLSRRLNVSAFAPTVIEVVEAHDVDIACVEVNNGYDFVVSAITAFIETEGGTVIRRSRKERTSVRSKTRQVIEYVCETASGHPFILKPVWQSVDKLTRAKAASVWWHQGHARHADDLQVLEKQMTTYDGSSKKSPDHLDGLTTAVAELAGERRGHRSPGWANPLDEPGRVPGDGEARHPLLAPTGVGNGPTPGLDPGRPGQSTWAARL